MRAWVRNVGSLLRWSPVLLLSTACNESEPESLDVPEVPAVEVPASQAISDEQVVERFHQQWYDDNQNTWARDKWLGILTLQNPMDAWITQEIIFDTRPDLIVETGAHYGGSAAMWATILEQVSPDGRVIGIDTEDNFAKARELPIVKKRVSFIIGDSTAKEVVEEVEKRAAGKRVMVILDSDHHEPHVLKELELYSGLVPVGGYVIVKATNVNGHPVRPEFGPGPWEAVQKFIKTNRHFAADKTRERLKLTFNPGGFLRRVR